MITFVSRLVSVTRMGSIDKIKAPILSEISLFEHAFIEALESDNTLLASVNEHILSKRGKQLRPILVMLSAKLCKEVNETTIQGAIAVELLHTASLIHDDVVDETIERRGKASVNAQWNNKIAILSGDYLLSKSLLQATKTQNYDILESISNIGMQLADGELFQLAKAQELTTTEKDYFTIIKKKTASLFASCAKIGALSVDANSIFVENLEHYGEYVGICFQIKDDIFDYSDNTEIGKPTGNDIIDGKITLPLVYALKKATENQKAKILAIIKNKDFTEENLSLITKFTHQSGGIDYATKVMMEYRDKAIAELSDFADGDLKQALIRYACFAAERTT